MKRLFLTLFVPLSVLAAAPTVPGVLVAEDYDLGFVLSRTEELERADFTPPNGAEVCREWSSFGASRDWFALPTLTNAFTGAAWRCPVGTGTVESVVVYSHGKVRISAAGGTWWLSPFETELGIAPLANRGMLCCEPCQFWHYVTPSNSLVMTWQNVLLDRRVDRPVSVQVELLSSGSMIYRYDLTRVENAASSRARVGVTGGGVERIYSGPGSSGVRSLYWARLDPNTKDDVDPDGDGLTTEDEIFLCRTDPYSADTDDDGLSDYDECVVYGGDPNDRYSINGILLDGFAAKLGGRDPFDYPEVSMLTFVENVFYFGEPDVSIALPSSDETQAILWVGSSGTGAGELFVGDQVVPLLPMGMELCVAVPRNVRTMLTYRGSPTLVPVLRSEDFCIGEVDGGWVKTKPRLLALGMSVKGPPSAAESWVEFPTAKPTPACIHTREQDEIRVTLEVEEGLEDLTCTWGSGERVVAVNEPPRAATLTVRFPGDESGWVTYTLDHPLYLCGEREFVQDCRYCPPFRDDEYSPNEEDPGDFWCCCWDGCPGCDCWCHYYEEIRSEGTDPDACPEHDCALEECEHLHREEYELAKYVLAQDEGVLKYHRPLADEDKRKLLLKVVRHPYHCCECPEHWYDHLDMCFRSRRVAVEKDGEPFLSSATDCEVEVYGVIPSDDFDDSGFEFWQGGYSYEIHDYTVFGVGIRSDSVDLGLLNAASASLGLPVPMQTDLGNAVRLLLTTDVKLSDGSVHLAFESADAGLELWMLASYAEDGTPCYVKLIDSATKPSLDLSVSAWRRLAARASYDRETEVLLVAKAPGSANLVFGYGAEHDGKGLYDEAVQRITAVLPPLLPDYDRDGDFDVIDAALSMSNRFRFWSNQDIWKGDDAFDLSFFEKVAGKSDDTNGQDKEVNGRNDLVNLLPMGICIGELVSHWGADRTEVVIRSLYSGILRGVYADHRWSEARSFLRKDLSVDGGKPIRAAALSVLEHEAEPLGESVLRRSLERSGVLYLECAADAYDPIAVDVRIDGKSIFRYTPQVSFVSVDDMFRWHDLRGMAAGGGVSESDLAEPAEPRGWPDADREDSDFYFVHGYNVSEQEAREWGRAMFKRLWWSGLNARFHVVTWYGNDSQFWFPFVGLVSPDYHVNVEHAIATAPALAAVVNSSKGRRYVAAHSLGNMLVSEAIQNHGLECSRYFMLNAAVAAEAYDRTAITAATAAGMTPEAWNGVPDDYRSTHWFEYGLLDAGDARRQLTWRNRFTKVDKAVNYYSTEEEVLKCDGKGESKRFLSRDWAWYNQERNKGDMPLKAGRNEGGWAFNSRYKVTEVDPSSSGGNGGGISYRTRDPRPEEIARITEDLREHPVFLPLEDKEMMTVDTVEEIPVAKQAQYLADAIPAESYPAGFVKVVKFDRVSDIENVNMAENFKQNTEIFSKDSERQWGHSYFLGAPYPVVYKLFDDIVTKMKGNKQ